MNNTIPVIAIFDVGKTNKKIFLFDREYKIVYEHSDKFDETKDEDGDPCEDIDLLTRWCVESFYKLKTLKGFSLCAVNFSAYGASFVHIDEQGNPLLPLYNYLKPYPSALKEKFFEDHGGEKAVSMATSSPVLGSLNSGMQLYRLKHEKDLFASKGYSLHLPQYLSYLITRRPYSDITSVGCHTMLWDFSNNCYHQWVTEENIKNRLAPLFSCDEIIGIADKNDLIAGAGLHDSAAALIPYLSSFRQPFVLLSTGTWCISLNPFNETPLTAHELEQDCLCYMTYKGSPVKASRLFAGHEHEIQVKKLAWHFGKELNHFKTVDYNLSTIQYLQENFIQDDLNQYFSPGPSFFNQRVLAHFRSYEEAYHQLILDIVSQQVRSTQIIMRSPEVKRLFVDGGFSKNPIFMNLLAVSFPDIQVFAASVAQATAIGAALAIHRHWNPQEIPKNLIDLKYYGPGQV